MTTNLQLVDRTVDLQRRLVEHQGIQTRLTPREVSLLNHLVHQMGTVVPREELLTVVCGLKSTSQTRTIDTTMANLRKKIEADPAHPVHLLTEYGVGYRFQLHHDVESLAAKPHWGIHDLGPASSI